MFKYLRYLGTHLLIALTIVGLMLGQSFAWLGIAAGVVCWIGADALSGAASSGVLMAVGQFSTSTASALGSCRTASSAAA